MAEMKGLGRDRHETHDGAAGKHRGGLVVAVRVRLCVLPTYLPAYLGRYLGI